MSLIPLLIMGTEGNNAPVNVVLPSFVGAPIVGSTLMGDPGTWTGSPTFTYQWQADGMDIGGATSIDYTLTSGEIGAMIRLKVTATNAFGSEDAFSAEVGPVIEGGAGSQIGSSFSAALPAVLYQDVRFLVLLGVDK